MIRPWCRTSISLRDAKKAEVLNQEPLFTRSSQYDDTLTKPNQACQWDKKAFLESAKKSNYYIMEMLLGPKETILLADEESENQNVQQDKSPQKPTRSWLQLLSDMIKNWQLRIKTLWYMERMRWERPMAEWPVWYFHLNSLFFFDKWIFMSTPISMSLVCA